VVSLSRHKLFIDFISTASFYSYRIKERIISP
jgi:hypothetical protein